VRAALTGLVTALALLPVPAASASEVLLVRGDGIERVDDPWLPAVFEDCATPAEAVSAPAPLPAAAASKPPSMKGTLDRLVRLDYLEPEQRREYMRSWWGAIRMRKRLGNTRHGSELAAVIRSTQSLVRRRVLTSTRVDVVFRQLRANTEYWPKATFPTPAKTSSTPCTGAAGGGGARVRFAGDPVVYQWYAGQGLQIQQLGTFGRINAMARNCLEPPSVTPCRLGLVRRGLQAIEELAVERGGFLAWEYYFTFGGGVPPWISGLAQGTAIQALTRGSRLFNEPRYLRIARRAVGAYRRSSPIGVKASGSRGPHFLLYSFNPGLRVFNGFFQALNGLYDYAQAADDARAKGLFHAADRQARHEARLADTGAWSRYSLAGAESDLGYHRLVRDFLEGLCARTKAKVYCDKAERFTRYQQEPARMTLRSAGRSGVRVVLSKISCVTLSVNGSVVSGRVLRRGEGVLPWSPRGGRRYAIKVDAKDLNGHHTVIERTVRVRRRG
jgi:hypothetical protein